VEEFVLGEAARSSGVRVVVRIGDRPVTVIGVRTLSPRGGVASVARDLELNDVAWWVGNEQNPVILVGDLNVTPWSFAFRRLLGDTGLRNSQEGWGLQPTWPDGVPPLMIPIDHALLSDGLVTVDRRTGPSLGSEHRSLQVEVGFGES
jgi:endonuclease/exonuclease/phosphatase (EEP) superfamily protein YafD